MLLCIVAYWWWFLVSTILPKEAGWSTFLVKEFGWWLVLVLPLVLALHWLRLKVGRNDLFHTITFLFVSGINLQVFFELWLIMNLFVFYERIILKSMGTMSGSSNWLTVHWRTHDVRINACHSVALQDWSDWP